LRRLHVDDGFGEAAADGVGEDEPRCDRIDADAVGTESLAGDVTVTPRTANFEMP
jgi:hypothetical protein